jgi:cyanate permease
MDSIQKMFGKLLRYLYEQTRYELHSALTVLVFASAYGIGFLCLWILFPVIGWEFSINFELSGYFIGCIGTGELARGLAKSTLSKKHKKGSHLTNAIAGATTIGTFWFCIALKWQHEIWTIPIAFIVGGLFYTLLEFARRFDDWFYSKI